MLSSLWGSKEPRRPGAESIGRLPNFSEILYLFWTEPSTETILQTNPCHPVTYHLSILWKLKTIVTAELNLKDKTETENKLKTTEWNALHVELIHIYLPTLLTKQQSLVK